MPPNVGVQSRIDGWICDDSGQDQTTMPACIAQVIARNLPSAFRSSEIAEIRARMAERQRRAFGRG
jgi:hypothetical protein